MPPRSSNRGNAQSSGSLASLFGARQNETRSHGHHKHTSGISNPSALYSESSLNLKQRILNEVNGGKNGINSKLLQTHRQRVWDIAFGTLGGDGVEVSTIEFSLICPYSRLAMEYPVRSKSCRHVQCCDLKSWIALLEKCRSMRDPMAPCPVCEQRVAASTLEIDCWQLHVLSQMPPGTRLVILDADGGYRSGDVSRDQKKRQVTEIIDSTQLADDGDDCGAFTPSPESVSSVKGETGIGSFHVKHERLSEERPELPPTQFSQGSCVWSGGTPNLPTQDDDLVVVCYIESKPPRRVLSSQARLWEAHCPRCKKMLVKSKDGTVQCCVDCGLGRDDWTFVRRFPDAVVSLELTSDGTLLLYGVDGIASHLSRAGFCRAVFLDESGTVSRGGNLGLWYTTDTLSRTELDFLEACCLRLACGELVDDIPSVPFRFRVRRPLRSHGIHGGEMGPTQTSYYSPSR
ncbi:uncharacterized protein TM35_000222020 [Trypanosoma theileri]|uniref:SP-RING-type domain-containing protein n=1 Tax=Trypanosoma theileri TaxID=67003 RepID=A0A1X0NSE9_9TRYP|nr:uncharacterized protein TM35_000222020 [Trypanosoma theileri]ORC87403.1 hypothetical protein TM35_000222020 [Trypanosoma theileri]